MSDQPDIDLPTGRSIVILLTAAAVGLAAGVALTWLVALT